MIAPVTHILPLTRIRRSRMLPGIGMVLAMLGQRVNATDVVAEMSIPGAHVLLDIRRALGMRRYDETLKLIDRKVGDRLEKGDVIAQTDGLVQRVVRAPFTGRIIAIQKGQVLLEQPGGKLELKAGLTGIIVDTLPDHGVVIEASGGLLQGVWGNYRTNIGLLLCQSESPDEELARSNLDMSMRGAIVQAGYLGNPDALAAANELPIRGLILGSMASHLIPAAMKVSFPILLTEGFGRIPMNSKAYTMLRTNEKRDVSLNSNWDPNLGDRPELFIPLPADGNPVLDTTEFQPGKTVRIHSAPYFGLVGVISVVRSGQTRFANGLRAPAADVRLENGQVVSLPLANIDVLE